MIEVKRAARDGSRRGVDREGYANSFRVRGTTDDQVVRSRRRRTDHTHHRHRRPATHHRHDHFSYGLGFTYGYYNGYHIGYHNGYHDGYFFGHRHYYGPHLVFGYHYGGFGFYDGFWHFAIVIGGPVHVHYRYGHYHYRWWDSRPVTLYSWDRAVEAYPADYSFDRTGKSCVALWISTEDGEDYEINIDPAYYDARDPGDLYAALWSELEQNGRLEIEDVTGAVHVFPAGVIKQIEATPCR